MHDSAAWKPEGSTVMNFQPAVRVEHKVLPSGPGPGKRRRRIWPGPGYDLFQRLTHPPATKVFPVSLVRVAGGG